jgi:hypothetical protein
VRPNPTAGKMSWYVVIYAKKVKFIENIFKKLPDHPTDIHGCRKSIKLNPLRPMTTFEKNIDDFINLTKFRPRSNPD